MVATLLNGLQKWYASHATLIIVILCFFSPTHTEQQVLQQSDCTFLMSETEVIVLGVTVDYELYFAQHISACCKKIARVFFLSYDISVGKCMFKCMQKKLEKIQERAFRILSADYNSSYMELLENKQQQQKSWYNHFPDTATSFKCAHSI